MNQKNKKPEIDKLFEAEGITYEESIPRKNIIDNRTEILNELNGNTRVMRSGYYLVIYDANPATISEIINSAIIKFKEYTIDCHRLTDKELAVFLKYNYISKSKRRKL